MLRILPQIKIHRSYWLILLLFLCTNLHASQKNKTKTVAVKTPLPKVLKAIGLYYGVNFIYEEKSVNNKVILFNQDELEKQKFTEVLNQVLTPEALEWYNIDNKNYSVFPSKKTLLPGDKPDTETAVFKTSSDSIRAGKVTGRILNESNRSQEFATVTLMRADSGVVSNVLTDTAGIYTFTDVKPGKYMIKASYSGYKISYSPEFTLSGTSGAALPPVIMAVHSKTLKEVVITASRALVETKSDRYVVNVANSVMASGNSVQLLKSVPFVQISPDNSISLQGKKTMILIDNKPIPDASLDNVLQSLPAGNISKVELITHPSAKYDASYGAVINITTKKSQIEGLTGNVRFEGSAGIYAQGNLNSTLTYKHKKLTIYGTGGLERSDNLFSINSERILGSSTTPDVLINNWRRLMHNKTYSYDGGVNYDISENQYIGFVVNGGVYHLNGPWTTVNQFSKLGAPIDSTLLTNSSFTNKVNSNNYNINYHLSADSGKSDLTVLSTYTTFRRDLAQNFPSVLLNSSGAIIRTPPTYRTTNISAINVYIAQVDYNRNFNKQWRLETGAKFQNTESSNTIDYLDNSSGSFVNIPANSSNNKLSESIFGAYGIISKDWKSNKLQLGLRGENTAATFKGYFNQNYLNFFPTLLVQHNFNADNNVSFTYKRTISRAPYSELVPYTVFINQYTIETGNPLLKPEYDNMFSINANIHKLSLSLNYTSAKGLIAQFPVTQNPDTRVTIFSRQNLQKSSDVSLYLYYPITVTKWWEMQNSGTLGGYTRAEGTVLGSKYVLSGFHGDFRSAQLLKVSNALKIEVDAYYWSKYPQDLTRNSGYKNIDAALLLDVLGGRGQFRLSGNQIIFKRNDYRLTRDFGVYQSTDVVSTDSRRIGVGFTYKFGRTKISTPDKKLGNEDALKRLN